MVTCQFINYFISDIHECLDSVSVCGSNSHCYNYNGSFSCFCWEGYNVSDVNKDVSKSNPCIGKIALYNVLPRDFQVLFIGNCSKR